MFDALKYGAIESFSCARIILDLDIGFLLVEPDSEINQGRGRLSIPFGQVSI